MLDVLAVSEREAYSDLVREAARPGTSQEQQKALKERALTLVSEAGRRVTVSVDPTQCRVRFAEDVNALRTKEAAAARADLQRLLEEELPHPISFAYVNLMSETDPRNALTRVFITWDAVLRFSWIVILFDHLANVAPWTRRLSPWFQVASGRSSLSVITTRRFEHSSGHSPPRSEGRSWPGWNSYWTEWTRRTSCRSGTPSGRMNWPGRSRRPGCS